ncbi:hypothetical protein PRZ48_000366 [Zasmidium cellare]|uniref:Uncharacterized protein n=1 Tax=Zasmidium cellare TaxID=395010 RepID=A0ABR0EY98_ZASCE|nr:hypothetical protein PRZ48_000366 [Zasmidium cellare]
MACTNVVPRDEERHLNAKKYPSIHPAAHRSVHPSAPDVRCTVLVYQNASLYLKGALTDLDRSDTASIQTDPLSTPFED